MGRFGEALKTLLVERGMSQAELARRVGVSPTAVTYWIAETVKPSPERVMRIEDELAVDPRGFLLEMIGYSREATDTPTVESLIRSDPGIDAEDKRVILRILALARERHAQSD